MTPTLCVFVPLLVAYATTLRWCWDRWGSPSQYFEHCYLVPVVAAVVLWWRRHEWRRRVAAPDRRGWWLLVPALLLHLAGSLLMVDSLSAASLVLAVPGAAWLALGRERLAGQWPVVWLCLFAVPLPIYVEGRLAFELKEIAVAGGLWLANLFGAGFERVGASLQPRGGDTGLFVADACGGLRSLLAMLTLGYCIAFFLGGEGGRSRRVVLLLLAGPIALAINLARIAGLCLLGRSHGIAFAAGVGHTVLDTLAWVVDVALLLLLDRWLSPRAGQGPAASAVPPPVAGTAGSLRVAAWVLWLLAGPLLALSLYRPFADASGRAERLPERIAGLVAIPRTPEQQAVFARDLPRWIELLGTRDFAYTWYQAAQGPGISLVALFHDANWKSVHPPRICIEGSNMDLEVDDLVELPLAGRQVAVSRIIARSREGGGRYVTLSVFGTRDWLSGSYSEFFWHHAPRAVLRASNAGFLLRAESFVANGEEPAAAERRCAAFLAELVPVAQELLP